MTTKRGLRSLFFVILALMIGASAVPQNCFAAFSLSVQPFGGGYDIRFGRLAASDAKEAKELTISITTTIGKQYRVYQRIESPLRTADGSDIEPNQLKMFTLINSNGKGTLERIEEYPVMLSDTLLYTSNTAGDSDTFKIAYTLTPSTSQVNGSYYGRVMYILRAIDSAQDQVYETLNMYADLSNEGKVEISTDTGSRRIRIASGDIERLSAAQYPRVKISVKGNMGAPYRIYQKLNDPQLKSESGAVFDLSKVTFESFDAKANTMLNQGDLSYLRSKTLVYSSDDAGTSAEVIIAYKPTKDFAEQKASFYTGSIEYYLEIDRARAPIEPGLIDAVDLEFEIEPVFGIAAFAVSKEGEVLKESGALLRFGVVDFKRGAQESKVRVKINSNLGRPYLVTQKLASPLENEQGDKIPDEQLTFTMRESELTKGKVKFEDEAVFESERDISIFVSDAAGDSDEFDITYRLKVTPDTHAGDYATQISYSLSEL